MLIPSLRARVRKCRRKRNHFVLVEAHHSVRWSFEHSLLYEFDRSRKSSFVVASSRIRLRRRVYTSFRFR